MAPKRIQRNNKTKDRQTEEQVTKIDKAEGLKSEIQVVDDSEDQNQSKDIKDTIQLKKNEKIEVKDKDKNIERSDTNDITNNKESDKLLIEVLKAKEETQREIEYEVIQKVIPTYTPNETILLKLSEIKQSTIKTNTKLFRLFEPKQLPIYRENGEKALFNRWYWKLKKDDLPDGDYEVRDYFLNLYTYILDSMPDYLLLSDMAVDNVNSRTAGKVVDVETADICNRIFQDEETEGVVRNFIAEMRQTVNADDNTVNYPSILHPIDAAFNNYFIDHQLVQPLNNNIVFNYIPERLRNDTNYIFNMDVTLPHIARYVPPLLTQDRLQLHVGFESIWDTLTKCNYVLARSVVPDLIELVSTEAQIQEMSQSLQLEALTIQSETQFLTGINSQAANECFKLLIASMLSQRTISIHFSPSNYMSLISAMYLLTVIPTSMFIRESLVACELAIINVILFPALGFQKLHYINDPRTPFEIAETRIQNFAIQNWLHFVNHNSFLQVVVDGVLNQTLSIAIQRGAVVTQLMDALEVLARQTFPSYPLDYRRSVTRGINLLSNRVGQLVDLTRLISYNYQTLMACITMNMQAVQTLTTESLHLTSMTSLCMLIGNTTVIPSPSSLFHYYNTNVTFHTNYNEKIDNTVAIIAASHVFNLYQKKMKTIVKDFLINLKIFDVERIPDDQMYRLRDRLRRLPVERRRLDVFQILQNNMLQIEQASDKIAQGVVIAYEEMPLQHDELYGFVNIARDINGYQQLNLEEISKSGNYNQITNILLNNQPVALVGAIPFRTDNNVISLIAKLDATAFAQIVKDRKINTLRPVMFKINSDSSDFFLVVNYNWEPKSSTKIFKQLPRLFDFRQAMNILTSNLTFRIFNNLLSFVSASTVEPINAVTIDGARIMLET